MEEKIGIFWVIGGEVYAYTEEISVENNAYTRMTGIIDSRYAHFDVWDKDMENKFPGADFATYPRGRVVYDIREKVAILYVDECITNGEIAKICAKFALKNPKIAYDEHYTCDQCIIDKELF